MAEQALAPEDEQRFEAFMRETEVAAAAGMPPELAQQIRDGLRRRFLAPPCTHMEACLGRAVPVDKARQLLFYPSEEDMALYCQLLALPPLGSDQDHPQFKVMVSALTMLYMAHCKQLARMRPFIEAGGLMCLVNLLAYSNLHVVSQALNSLLLISDEELYPWHDPPITPDGRGPRQGPDRLMWRSMFDLSRSPLIPNLLRLQPDVFPGSALLALRVFAFYTSWTRRHFTPNGVLRLSSQLLQVLQEWSERQGTVAEEQHLAKQLYDDFARFPPAEHPAAPQLGSIAEETTVERGGGEEQDNGGIEEAPGEEEEERLGVKVVADRTQVNSVGPSQAEHLKKQGNVAYREGLYSLAIRLYSEAMDVPVAAGQLLDEGSRRAVYHANRAAAYLGRASAGPMRAGDRDSQGLLEGVDHGEEDALHRHWKAALMDADSALELNPNYSRAYLRKAQALQKLQRLDEALAAARLGVNGVGGSSGASGQLAEDLHEIIAEVQAPLPDVAATAAGAQDRAKGLQQAAMDAARPASRGGSYGQAGSVSASNGPSGGTGSGIITNDLLGQLARASMQDSLADPTSAAAGGIGVPATAAAGDESSGKAAAGLCKGASAQTSLAAGSRAVASMVSEGLDLYSMD